MYYMYFDKEFEAVFIMLAMQTMCRVSEVIL